MILLALATALSTAAASPPQAAGMPLPSGDLAAPPVSNRLPPDASVELHAHLFMKDGLGWFFKGRFEGPIMARSHEDGLASQVDAAALDASGAVIVVVSLYSNPFFNLSMRESLRRQINAARALTRSRPGWIIARSAAEAEAALNDGKRVLILHLEGASGMLETEEDLREFIDEAGIRIVAPMHFTDDRFGGAALMEGLKVLGDPIAWLKTTARRLLSSLTPPKPGAAPKAGEDPDVPLNANGLSDDGRRLVESLLKRGVWIDLSHASDESQRAMVPLIRAQGHPLLYTHTPLRAYHGAERGISAEQLREVARSGGIVGAMPSETMLNDTRIPPEWCPHTCPNSAGGRCEGGIAALAVQYRDLAAVIGSDSVMLGSDWHGGVLHLKPSCGTGTRLDEKGLWQMGLQPEVWKALRKLGAPVPERLSRTVDRFLGAWRRVKTGPQ